MLDEFIPFSSIALVWAPCHRSEGFSERDVSSLRAFGPGGRQVLAIAHVSARAFLWMSDTLTTATHTRTPACGGFAPPRLCCTGHATRVWGAEGRVDGIYIYIYICKFRHEPIGVRGFLRFGTVFVKIVGPRERNYEEKQMLDAPYFHYFPLMLHMLDSYFPLCSNMFEMWTSVFW